MKFESNLRPQDKKTIAIVLYAAIVILFCWYMIRPAVLNIVELDDKIKEAKATQQEYRMKSINLGTAEVLYDKAVTDITASTEDFYDVMDNSEIEKMGTEYILNFGLTPVNFTIDLRDGSYVSEAPYKYAEIEGSSAAPAAVVDTTDITDTTGTAAFGGIDVQSLQVFYSSAVAGVSSTEPSEVQCARITIVVRGSQKKCQEMIDDLTHNPSIRVTDFTWGNTEEIWVVDTDGNKTLVNAGDRTLTISLNFYMTDKPQFETEEG